MSQKIKMEFEMKMINIEWKIRLPFRFGFLIEIAASVESIESSTQFSLERDNQFVLTAIGERIVRDYSEQIEVAIDCGTIDAKFFISDAVAVQSMDFDRIGADVQVFRMQRNVLRILDHINLVFTQTQSKSERKRND